MRAILLVGEDDAFPMYAEYLRLRGLDVSLHTSPPAALNEMARSSPAVIVTELAFGRDPQRGGEFIAAARRLPSGQSCAWRSSSPGTLAPRTPRSHAVVERIAGFCQTALA